jgi:hypothetical protein
MKETGLMFKAPLVRAILSGQKTQTRRLWKMPSGCVWYEELGGEKEGWVTAPNQPWWTHVEEFRCPMGKPGDRIYVRETWQGPLLSNKEWEDHYFSDEEALPCKFETPAYCQYAADGGPPPEFTTMDDETVARWKPSIHMPKWAARIWLEITVVRVERLQQITEADCISEGAPGGHGSIPGYPYSATPLEHFRHIWESTGGDWAANPWVWVIDFKTISTTGRSA